MTYRPAASPTSAPSKPAPVVQLLHGGNGVREPQPNVVELLRTYLERAEKGELIGVAIAFEYANGDGGYFAAHGSFSRPATLVANLETVKLAIIDRFMRAREA